MNHKNHSKEYSADLVPRKKLIKANDDVSKNVPQISLDAEELQYMKSLPDDIKQHF